MLILAKPFQIVPNVPVTPDFLLHIAAPHFDQYWLQLLLLYAILDSNIVRDTGQFKNVANGRNNLMMHNEDASKRQIQSVTAGAVNHDR